MNMFQRKKVTTASTPSLPPRPSKEGLSFLNPVSQDTQDAALHSDSQESSSEATTELNLTTKKNSVMGVMQKVNPFKSNSQASSAVSKAPTTEPLVKEVGSSQNPGVLKGVMEKVNPFKSSSQVHKATSSESLDQGKVSDSSQNAGVLKGVMQKVNPFKASTQAPKIDLQDSSGETRGEPPGKQNAGVIAGMMQKVNPFKSAQPKDVHPLQNELLSSEGSLSENNNLPEKQNQNSGMFKGMIQKVNPFKSYTQTPHETDSMNQGTVSSLKSQEQKNKPSAEECSTSSDNIDDSSIERYTIWYTNDNADTEVKKQSAQAAKKRTMTFRVKRILPGALFRSGTKSSTGDTQQEVVQVETVQMAEVLVPADEAVEDPLEDEEGLLAWWKIVEGWQEWQEANQDDDSEQVVEEAADRVFMAARLFVRFFNQRGGLLQQRILELLELADAADNFHKKTVTASVGGGVASVAGSITTITGLILAPFTAGTSLIVTAVGIGVATAGGLASASANITDTVHSKTDRKKVEAMIQQYQEEIKDIKECLDFLQEGMQILEECHFEEYVETISKKHLNQNIKHVMKEGGRAGKALAINTESLISTIQVLNVAGGAAKAVQVMSVTTGVMSGLFLALDVFFLAKDSVELKKGAKTEFAAKIREVCKDLQDGLLELNRIKEQLQKTMDGIEVEVEEEEQDEESLKCELKKLVEVDE